MQKGNKHRPVVRSGNTTTPEVATEAEDESQWEAKGEHATSLRVFVLTAQADRLKQPNLAPNEWQLRLEKLWDAGDEVWDGTGPQGQSAVNVGRGQRGARILGAEWSSTLRVDGAVRFGPPPEDKTIFVNAEDKTIPDGRTEGISLALHDEVEPPPGDALNKAANALDLYEASVGRALELVKELKERLKETGGPERVVLSNHQVEGDPAPVLFVSDGVVLEATARTNFVGKPPLHLLCPPPSGAREGSLPDRHRRGASAQAVDECGGFFRVSDALDLSSAGGESRTEQHIAGELLERLANRLYREESLIRKVINWKNGRMLATTALMSYFAPILLGHAASGLAPHLPGAVTKLLQGAGTVFDLSKHHHHSRWVWSFEYNPFFSSLEGELTISLHRNYQVPVRGLGSLVAGPVQHMLGSVLQAQWWTGHNHLLAQAAGKAAPTVLAKLAKGAAAGQIPVVNSGFITSKLLDAASGFARNLWAAHTRTLQRLLGAAALGTGLTTGLAGEGVVGAVTLQISESMLDGLRKQVYTYNREERAPEKDEEIDSDQESEWSAADDHVEDAGGKPRGDTVADAGEANSDKEETAKLQLKVKVLSELDTAQALALAFLDDGFENFLDKKNGLYREKAKELAQEAMTVRLGAMFSYFVGHANRQDPGLVRESKGELIGLLKEVAKKMVVTQKWKRFLPGATAKERRLADVRRWAVAEDWLLDETTSAHQNVVRGVVERTEKAFKIRTRWSNAAMVREAAEHVPVPEAESVPPGQLQDALGLIPATGPLQHDYQKAFLKLITDEKTWLRARGFDLLDTLLPLDDFAGDRELRRPVLEAIETKVRNTRAGVMPEPSSPAWASLPRAPSSDDGLDMFARTVVAPAVVKAFQEYAKRVCEPMNAQMGKLFEETVDVLYHAAERSDTEALSGIATRAFLGILEGSRDEQIRLGKDAVKRGGLQGGAGAREKNPTMAREEDPLYWYTTDRYERAGLSPDDIPR
eukprot:g8260.t1